ncbi:hypothetical protein DFJ74DRAFT_665773 [Hyaloraphidium curvatum]|nr:hypothetical protein DFJ74DRAFT_665773 [Hyaloraphidium curvatum]
MASSPVSPSAASLAEENERLRERVEQLKREKADLMVKLEEEEDYITNTLTRKLHALQRDKVDIENQLEQEQEFIVNRLQKQLEDARVGAPVGVAIDTGMARSRSRSGSMSTRDEPPPSPGVADILRAEVTSLRQKINSMEQSHEHIVRAFRTCTSSLKSALLAARGLPESARAELDAEFAEPETPRPLLGAAPLGGKEFAVPTPRARSRSRRGSGGGDAWTPSTAVGGPA